MKKIVPFNNILDFKTDVCDITAISLEHDISKEHDLLSGVFYVTGEYKITSGQIDNEKFSFDLPFDIALSDEYDLDSLVVDIDDFRYELIDNNKLKVNIDLYIDGEIIEKPQNREIVSLDEEPDLDFFKEPIDNIITKEETKKEEQLDKEEPPIEEELPVEEERLDLLDEMLLTKKEEPIMDEIEVEQVNNNENNNINIFNNLEKEEEYVTYKVYRVLDGDSLDTIMNKYNVTKEELENYNDITNIKAGDKLIIPTND